MFIKKSTEIPKSICNQGFTLIEVLIAMSIFAIGILAVGSMQVSAINKYAGARNSTTVVTVAKDRVEELNGLAFDDADLDAGEHIISVKVSDDVGNTTYKTFEVDVVGS